MVTRTNTPRNTKHRTTARYEASTLTYKDALGNPVFNHKVEQVLRAITTTDCSLLNVYSTGENIQWDFIGDDYAAVNIGTGYTDTHGTIHYKFRPETNSMLALLRLNGNVLLQALSSSRLDGGLVTISTKDGGLITPYCVLLDVAYQAVFNYDVLVAEYNTARKQVQYG